MYTNNKKHNYNKNNLKNSWEKNATREKGCANSLVALPESDKYG